LGEAHPGLPWLTFWSTGDGGEPILSGVISECGPWQAKHKYQVAFHRVTNHMSFLHFTLVIGQLLHNSTPSGRSQPIASEFGSGPLMSKLPLFLQSRNLKSTSKAKMRFAEMFQSVSCGGLVPSTARERMTFSKSQSVRSLPRIKPLPSLPLSHAFSVTGWRPMKPLAGSQAIRSRDRLTFPV
jgi:hypothetical protein